MLATCILDERQRARSILAVAVLVLFHSLSMFLLDLPAGAATASAATLVPEKGAHFGVWAKPRSGETVQTALTGLEADSGRKFAMHRVYGNWDDLQPSSLVEWNVDNGRTPILGIVARRADGARVRWSSIASGSEDASIVAKARGLKGLDLPIWVVFHHEPEDDADTHSAVKNGTPEEFIAAWRHVVDVFRQEGATNVAFVWNMMAYSFKTGSAESYYPGDNYVDWAAADGYNWYGCDNTSKGRWLSFSQIFESFRDWGVSHGKPLMLAEWGSIEDPNVAGRKGAWISHAAATVKSWPEIKALSYFHSRPSSSQGGEGGPSTCEWWVDSSTTSLEAFTAMANDPYFNPPAMATDNAGAVDSTSPPCTERTCSSTDDIGDTHSHESVVAEMWSSGGTN